MAIEELINLITNNSVAVRCLAYFMWYNNTTMKEMKLTIANLTTAIDSLCTRVNK